MGIAARFFGSFGSTLAARARRGPLLPSWSLFFEVSIEFLRRTAHVASGRAPLVQRATWAELKPPPSPSAKEVRRTSVDAGGVRGEWVEPRAGHSDAVVVFLHGGAFIYGSLVSHGEMIERIALASGARVLALDYRLAPEHVFPAAIDDVATAYGWLRAQGVSPAKVVFAGDSAGGNLAVTSLLRLRERGEPMPAGSVPICPWVDLTRAGGSLVAHERYDWGIVEDFPRWAETYAPGVDHRGPLVSPLFADLAGLCPLAVLYGEREMLFDQVTDFVARAKSAGVDVTAEVYPDMVHNWLTLPRFTPQAERAYQHIGAFVRRVTGT